MNPAPSDKHAEVVQQLAEVLGPLARAARLIARMGIFNLGEPENCRIPDGALMRERGNRACAPTAALVVEVVSPDDDTWKRPDFSAAHQADQLLIVDPGSARFTG